MSTPYHFIKHGNLYMRPVTQGPQVPYLAQAIDKPREFSLWVNGAIQEPSFQLDAVRMPPSLYQEVRNDLVRYSPVEVSRSAFTRSNHAYTGVIDSKGKPYYFALDSRGISVREAKTNDENVWKTFDRLADHERSMATSKRRIDASAEVRQMNRELSAPMLVIKAGHTGTMVALHIPHDIAKQVAIPGGESPETMHVTVAYLGKNLTDEQKSGAFVACRRIAQKCGPIKALLGGVGRFSASSTSEGNDVIYLSVDSPDLTRMRPMLIEELAIEGVVPNNLHGYVPHVTLAYIPTTAPHPLKRFPPVAVEFSAISLTVADEKMMLPFTTPLVIKALHPNAAWATEQLKAGKQVKHENGTRAYASTKRNATTGKEETSHYTVVSPNGAKTFHDTAESAGLKAHEHTKDHKPAELPKATAKFKKALPKKSKEEKVKKTPSRKASKKQTGAGGKTRYTYPNEKLGAGGAKKPGQQQQPLLVVRHDDSKNADPSEFANQLGVSVRTLQRCAKKLGREGFSKFMRSHLKRFSAKHRLDPDYWGTLYEKLQPGVD